MRFWLSASIALLSASSVTALFDCGASSPSLNPYCCESATNYPRGYAGTNCANATAVTGQAPKCKNQPATTRYSCPNAGQAVQICCQQLEALGTNPQPVAYYCGQPITN